MEKYLGYKDLAPVHKDVALAVHEVENGKRRGLFLLPRGHLKSTEITISYSIQQILRNPDIRILITNALLENSKGFLREIKGHLEKNELLRALFGELKDDDKWSEMQIITKQRQAFHKEPTVQVTAVDKSVVSQHYDLIIADDIVNRESISTKEQRVKTIKYYKDLLDLLEPGGTLIVIGTRWHYDDLYGYLISENVKKDNFHVTLRQAIENDQPLFPRKFPMDYLTQLKEDKGSYEFNCQYMNNPINDEDADFKKEYFKYFNLLDVDPTDGDIYITIDPAISKADTADYTGIVVNLVKGGRWKILEARRIRLNPTELINEMFYLYRKYKHNFAKMAIESIMYTQALQYDITRRMQETGEWFQLDEVRHRNRKKEERIRGLIPLFERGNIEMSDR